MFAVYLPSGAATILIVAPSRPGSADGAYLLRNRVARQHAA